MYFKILTVLLVTLISTSMGRPSSKNIKNIEALQNDAIYDTFKFNLMRYYGVGEAFAEQFKKNLKKAVEIELNQLKLLRQGGFEEDEDEDEIEPSTTTTEGPGAFNIVNGIYGILSGVGTLNPDRVFSSSINFFPPSQKQTAQALIDSALGQKVKFPTPTTTIPTTTKPTTTTKDEYDEDEDEDLTTKAAVAVTQAGTIAPPIEKYTIKPAGSSEAVTQAASSAPALPPSASTSSGSLADTTVQDDEVDSQTGRYIG